jgi:hypothetical protein
VQVLRQDRVLDRPEQGRMAAEQEQRPHQHRQAGQEEARRRNAHDGHLLDQAGRPPCRIVGQLPGGGREQEEGQDEDAGRQVGQQLRPIVVQLAPPGR